MPTALEALRIPGNRFVGRITVPGSNGNVLHAVYTLETMRPDDHGDDGVLVVAHTAFGDEQVAHVRLHGNDEVRYGDAETTCVGRARGNTSAFCPSAAQIKRAFLR